MEIRQYMTKEVQTCRESDTVLASIKKMTEYDIGSLIVIKDNKPIGIFTERDLMNKVIALEFDPANITVDNVMSTNLVTLNADESVGWGYHILINKNVRHAPVIEDGKLVGIVSRRDLAKIIDERFSVTYFGKYGKRDYSGEY